MHCEGDKLYDNPGSCPVCGMNLEKYGTKEKVQYTCPMHPEVIQDGPVAALFAVWISSQWNRLKKKMQLTKIF